MPFPRSEMKILPPGSLGILQDKEVPITSCDFGPKANSKMT
jgi:hypothetical protein